MDSPESPSDLVEILLAGNNPSVTQWEQVQRLVDSGARSRDEIRSGLDADQERRWATAVVLAHLGASDGDELALDVLREFDWALTPGPAYHSWEQAAWHVQDALAEGRQTPATREIALDVIGRAGLDDSRWTDPVDEALALLKDAPLDAEVTAALRRVAAEHWLPPIRQQAEAMLEGTSL
jgi:hypothetical protein